MSSNPPRVLYVEDDEVDALAMKRVWEKSEIENPLEIATDGVEALRVLRSYSPAERPQIVLLDINMPKMSGLEFLSEVRKDPELKNLVVFMLTTSSQPEDVRKAYDLLAAGYLQKPSSVKALSEIVRGLKIIWDASLFNK